MADIIYAEDFGFLPANNGNDNREALQRMLDIGGNISVRVPGVYLICGGVTIGSDTSLAFSDGVTIKREHFDGGDGSLIINKGAYTRKYDNNISITGMKLVTNGVDINYNSGITGIYAQIAFFYANNISISNFECMDLGKQGFCIQICTFANATVENVKIEGKKDAVHFGTGKNFIIRNGEFRTFDDPIALNAHDYAISNPQMGWIENGIIENCVELDQPDTTGFFVRMLAGAWSDWKKDMIVRNSDTVVSCGRMYRVVMPPDGKEYVSVTPPTHERGEAELDGIRWVMTQDDNICYNCGCRNIHFKNIRLSKNRPVAFSFHFDNDVYSHSYYPYATAPIQENITLENVTMDKKLDWFIFSTTPVTNVRIINSNIDDCGIRFGHRGVPGIEYGNTDICFDGVNFSGETFISSGEGRSTNVVLKSTKLCDGASFYKKGTVNIVSSDIDVEQR